MPRKLSDFFGVEWADWEIDPSVTDNTIAAYDASLLSSFRSQPKSESKPKYDNNLYHDLLNTNAVPCPHCHHHTTYIHSQSIKWAEFQTEIEIGGHCKRCDAEFDMTLIPFNG